MKNPKSITPAVILVRPQEDGNVGAVARAMANMGLERLILVEPAVALGRAARAFAVKAGWILDGAQRVNSFAEAVAPFRFVLGTTSSRSRQLGIPLATARQAAQELVARGEETLAETALVFGPEASGMTTEELSLSSQLVSIPCDARQPTLNLAQAVLLVSYELSVARREQREGREGEGVVATRPELRPSPAVPEEPRATAGQVEGLFGQVQPLLRQIGFARDDTFETVLRDLRQLSARSEVSEREVAILRGICRRAARALELQERKEEG